MVWRYYISESHDPFHNLAVEELLLHSLAPGEMVLYLWQNEDTIVIGKNQNAWRECLVEEFAAEGGSLARRLSGGGAVYHDLGNQNFTFLAREGLYDVARQCEVIRRAAASFGIDVQCTGRNDILADGRKFSGNAFYQSGQNRYHHGTILVSSDMARLGRFLNPSKEKLEDKGVASVRARVVNLAELNSAVTPANMRAALLAAMGEVYCDGGTPLEAARLDPASLATLRAKYASAEWRLRRQLPFTHRLAARLALGEVELLLTIRDGMVQKATLYTDALDPSWAKPLGESLAGQAADGEALAAVVKNSGRLPGTDGAALADWLRREFVL